MAKVNISSEFFTTEEVARFLRCSIKTVYYYRHCGKIKAYHRASKRGRLLFRREEVEKLMIPDEREAGMPHLEGIPLPPPFRQEIGGKRDTSHALVPEQNQSEEEISHYVRENPVGISLDEAIPWIANEIPADYDVTQDSVYNMKGHESDASADLSLLLEEYLYGREVICQK